MIHPFHGPARRPAPSGDAVGQSVAQPVVMMAISATIPPRAEAARDPFCNPATPWDRRTSAIGAYRSASAMVRPSRHSRGIPVMDDHRRAWASAFTL